MSEHSRGLMRHPLCQFAPCRRRSVPLSQGALWSRMPPPLTTRGLPGRRPPRNAWAPARKEFSPAQEPPVPAEAPPRHSPGQGAGCRGCAKNGTGPGLARSIFSSRAPRLGGFLLPPLPALAPFLPGAKTAQSPTAFVLPCNMTPADDICQ